MKKYILNLLVILVAFSACQKEDDLLQPIPAPPTTQTTITDTIVNDTVTSNTNIIEELQDDYETLMYT